MRSLAYFPALLPFYFLNVNGVALGDDATIVITTTRTVTICPITDMFTCAPTDITRPWLEWSMTSSDTTTTTTYTQPNDETTTTTSPATTTMTTSHNGDGPTTTTGHEGDGSTTTTTHDHDSSTTTTTTREHEGTTTTSTVTTTTNGHDDSGSTTTTTSFTTTTTGAGNSTTTTTTTTTSSCNGTHTAGPTLKAESCNDASNRQAWCGGRSVNTDTHDDQYFSGNFKQFHLTISKADINFDGVAQPAFAINGKTPGEAIEVNWGDMVTITVTNNLPDNATTIHWHGVRQVGTNDQDGVPGVTECAIAPGQTRTYTWHASTYGTGWYHSHTLAQYGGGIRGPIIIHGPASANYDLDMGTVMINEKWEQTIFQLAYNIARVAGRLPSATNYLLNGKNLSPNGTAGEASKWVVKSGKKHLFRIINRYDSNPFY